MAKVAQLILELYFRKHIADAAELFIHIGAGDGASHVVEGRAYDFGDLFGHAVGDRGHFRHDLAPGPTGLFGQTGRVERVLNIKDFGLAG